MDISDLNPIKRKFMWMLKIFNTFYKKSYAKSLHDLLENTGNPLTRTLYDITKQVVDHMSPYLLHGNGSKLTENSYNRYREMIQKPMELFLSIPTIDSAYIDPFHWAAYQFGKKCREDPVFWKYMEDNVKTPDMWYYNIWNDFKHDTQKQKQTGEIDYFEKSEGESLMVDNLNTMRFNDFIKEQQKKHQKYNHW